MFMVTEFSFWATGRGRRSESEAATDSGRHHVIALRIGRGRHRSGRAVNIPLTDWVDHRFLLIRDPVLQEEPSPFPLTPVTASCSGHKMGGTAAIAPSPHQQPRPPDASNIVNVTALQERASVVHPAPRSRHPLG